MIYIEENDFKRQIELLTFIARTQELDICAWLYPESNNTELAGMLVTDNPQSLCSVTAYENGVSPKCTAPVLASDLNISLFSSAYSDLKKNCDSLALYNRNCSSWLAATIGHEGMCLVQDETLLNSLVQAGFAVTTKAPDWW